MKKITWQNIDDYISQQPEEMKETLEKLRQIIKKNAPKAEEVISYQMPAFRQGKVIVWFAGTKNHYALYPSAKPIEVFKKELKPYDTSKGTIRFPWDKPIPTKLIGDIVKFRLKEIAENGPTAGYAKKAAKKTTGKTVKKKK